MAEKVHVIGVGVEGAASLTPAAARMVEEADALAGGARLLALFPGTPSRRVPLGADVAGTLACLAGENTSRLVILASGDPSFYGVARAAVQAFGSDRVEIMPNVSSVQLAFARVRESWEDAEMVSVHGRPLAGLASIVRRRPKVALLTGGPNTPAVAARHLINYGLRDRVCWLCEDLGLPAERVRKLTLESLAETETSALSIVILLACSEGDGRSEDDGCQKNGGPVTTGISDERFAQRKPLRGLITKREVRVLAVSTLGLREESVIWDVGAGSGSVSVEAALASWRGRVFAIEEDAEDRDNIQTNARRFGTDNLEIIAGRAPEMLAGLLDPSAVFIGGSGGEMPAILDAACSRLRPRGRVVITAATLETALEAAAGLRARGFAAESTLVQISRGRDLAGRTHFSALDPVVVVAGWRETETSQ